MGGKAIDGEELAKAEDNALEGNMYRDRHYDREGGGGTRAQ